MNSTFITESLITFLNTKQPKYLVDNFYYSAWWEMDLVQVTRTDLINEYEIKVSKSDFNADFKKVKKHHHLNLKTDCPNRFSFVVPEGLVSVEDVPSYAGLLYVKEDGKVEVIKKPPFLHKEKIKRWFFDKLTQRIYWRYFDLKRKYNSLILQNQRNGK